MQGQKVVVNVSRYNGRCAQKEHESCLTVHLPHEIKWNANLMQLGNFIDVSGTYGHHQEH